jgi:hypothetical protein
MPNAKGGFPAKAIGGEIRFQASSGTGMVVAMCMGHAASGS